MFRDLLKISTKKGEAVAEVSDEHLNELGIAHGGFIASLLDEAMGSLIEEKAVTVSLTIDYLEMLNKGEVKATAEIVRKGKDLVFCEGRVYQNSKVVAKGSGIYFILKQ